MWLAMMLVACQGEEEHVPGTPDCDKKESWPDADGDGHGDPLAESTLSCEVPSGQSLTADDCDDTDSTVFPGAPERCDGRPNDCDAPDAVEEGLIMVGESSFSSLQEALDAASEGDEVQVCAGTYSGTFVAPVAVSLVGAGRELTTLDGGDAGTVLTVPPGSHLIGLTLTQGQAEIGGGLLLTEAGELVVEDCALTLNTALKGGGAAIPPGSTVSFPGTLVQINTAREGGGIFAGQGATLDLTDAVIDDNRADYGGGISGVELTLTGGLVKNNSAEDTTGPPSYLGGAGMLLEGTSSVTGTEIASNTAAESGGGIAMSGGDLVLLDVWIHDNDGGYEGGGMELDQASGLLEGSTTLGPGNVCSGFGGGASVSGGGLTGGEIHGNSSYEGGGVYGHQTELVELWVHDNHADVGGGIELRGGVLADSIVEHNTAGWVAGLFTDASGYGAVTVTDTTIAGNVSEGSSGGVSIDADDNPNTVFTRVTVTDNEGTNGGGISVSWGRARLVDCAVLRNVATEGPGGGLRVEYSGSLEVSGTDLGADADDNSPSDVSTSGGGAFHGYGASSTFTCNTSGCTPTP
jgi:hypothetical protein